MSSKALTKTTPSKPPSKTTQKPKAPSTKPKKPQPRQDRGNWISRSVQGWVAGAGSAVGGGISAVGNGVNSAGRGIGDSVTGAARGWADGIRSYGNAVKDATGAAGTRALTGLNPLGIAGQRGTWAPSKQVAGPRNAGGGTAGNPLGLK